MQARYKISSDKLDSHFLRQIKKQFKDRHISITIETINNTDARALQNTYENTGEPIYSFTASELEEQMSKNEHTKAPL